MRAVRFDGYGGPEVLTVGEVPVPRPGDGEVLIEVGAAGVTLPIVRLTRGGPDGGVPLPHVPGGEVAGRIVRLGSGVPERPGTGWQVGQRVTGLAFSGAYAQFAAVPVEFLDRVPDGVDDADAVALVRSGHVASAALHLAGLREGESEGERVLVTSAAGGVGHLAVQLARALGAGRVVAAIGGGSAKKEFLRGLGADRIVTYAEARAGLDESFDVVLDGTGADVQDSCLAALAPLGRLVSFNATGGKVDVNELRMTARTVIGLAMRHFAEHRRDVYDRHGQRLWELLASGAVRPAIHAVLPLEQAADAYRVIEARANLGKIVLNPMA
ncbi:quinone oxidoreductase family protein [Rugosimonospora africana]|uniref:Oxidoreductase n=1 Tax=Rugosimonospora africana TaxID=556532 RepID=A0A8J3QT85_9ACTN|nr:zinc-binding dehydrogenase [Rugosimonospora africana]GIH17040.1 oxidoreductase [Rugosimonospora africana]